MGLKSNNTRPTWMAIAATIGFFLWAWSGQVPATAQVQENGIVIIVNNENPVGPMDKSEVKLFYLRIVKHSWPGNKAIIRPAYYSGDNMVMDAFLKKVLRMTKQQMQSYFRGKEYSESLPMPPAFASEEEIVNYVANNKGGIAYVSSDAYTKYSARVKMVLEVK
jgi:ABC-type phosphate transport system substrate-binding protein